MKTYIALIILLIGSLPAFAQNTVSDKIENLHENEQYQKIIDEYTSNYDSYAAKDLYYIGRSYFMLEDDENCIKFMDLSILKDANSSIAHYFKGVALNYMKKYEEAIDCFNKAINLKQDADFYSALADSYYNLKKYNEAIENYKKACELDKTNNRASFMIAQIYMSNLDDEAKALDAFYAAKANISKESKLYVNTLFNIGLLEVKQNNYDKAESAYSELILLDTEDFHAYAKLIQIHYHRKEYDKAKPFKAKLYDAQKKGLLKDSNFEDMFCFDQFKWNDKLIQGFERYEVGPSDNIFRKIIFYVKNDKGEIDYTIQTEYSPPAIAMGEATYVLCMTKGNTRGNFGIGFNDDLNYDVLKKYVIEILEGKLKLVAAFTF